MMAIARRFALPIYGATIFLSALLLFSVQPMITKMALPVFGGAPATWAVALCFFQALLLLGYAYAHVLDTHAQRMAPAVHVLVLLLALTTLPVQLSSGWSRSPPGDPTLWLLGLLAGSVGLPFFALSANAPLLQAWFARLGHARSANPYFLYAASNAGSLVALLAYPVAIEPLLPLRLQGRVWTAGFVLLALVIAACGALMLSSRRPVRPESADPAPPPAPAVIAWRERAIWTFLAFVPSGLLVAFTTFLTTDLASAPLLWVIPLALFLATFIVVFRDRPLISHRLMLRLQPPAIAAVLVAGEWIGDLSWAVGCLAGLLAFVVTCLVCHHELYRRRPAAAQLTEFYFWMSLGGVLGGSFAALLAPIVFTDILEFPLLLGAGMLCRPDLWQSSASRAGRIQLAGWLGAAVAVIVLVDRLVAWGVLPQSHDLRLYVLAVLGLGVIAAMRWPRLELALVAAIVLGVAKLPRVTDPVHVTRSFFGTHRVVDTAGGRYRLLIHGTTVHGIQDIQARALAAMPVPLGYYHPTGPLGRGVGLARQLAGGTSHSPLRIGLVGLGTGALACYARAGDSWRLFEIDPAVARIATTPEYFRYLAACLPDPDIVLGDARLTLARQPAGSFDYLVIDAFSSDAIPIHLLTIEAFELYARLLSGRGILALHISNQNMDLPPVVEANLAAMPGWFGVYVVGAPGPGALASQVVLISRHPDALAAVLTAPRSRRLGEPTVRAWTDDYSDVFSAVVRRYGNKLGLRPPP
jgi:hypothetical protein